MGNLKHSFAAIIAVALVGVLAAIQAYDIPAVGANKLTQEPNIEQVEVQEEEEKETAETEAAETEAQEEAQEEEDADKAAVPEIIKGEGDGEFADISSLYLANQAYINKKVFVLTDGSSVNLRAEADIESDAINFLPLGTEMTVIEINGEWFKVEADGMSGYVKACYTTLDYDAVKAVMLATIMYQKATATAGVNVRSEANEDAVILSAIAAGDPVTVLDEFEGWCKVYFGTNYDIGYVKSEYLDMGDMVLRSEVNARRNKRISAIVRDGKIKISKDVVDVKLMPDEESDTIVTLANGANCKIVSGGKNWTKIIVSATNEIGYVKTANVAEIIKEIKKPAKTDKKTDKTGKTGKNGGTVTSVESKSAPAVGSGSKLVEQAAKYLGVKYVYGGSSPSGFDCSGLVQYCCRQLGVSVNRTASAQYSNGVYVSRDNLRPGDLIFFSRGGGRISHVVIYAGDGMVIHAPHTGKTVSYQSLSKMCSYSHYVGARRVM